MNKKYLIFGIGVLVIIGVLVWAFIESNKPLPGIEAFQYGREHKAEGTKLDYKYSPPTSGDHYPSWITKGFYDEPRPDGNVVHSQEHGYIIFWYDCGAKLLSSFFPIVYAQGATSPDSSGSNPSQGLAMTGGSEGSPSAKLSDLPESFRNGSCDSLKNQIKEALKNYGSHKLIAMPRPKMGTPLILTAWGKMEKLNKVDMGKIKEFIDAYRDNGPEQTNEP